MIHEVEGDILLTRAQVIAHGIAANDPMNQGLALTLHDHYPAMHKDFHHWCHLVHPKPGDAWMWGGPDNIRIINLITQEGGYGSEKPGKASISNVNHCLKSLKKIIQAEGFESIAMPRLATGVGGLDWKDVRPLIDSKLGELDINVYLYAIFHAGQQAEERG